MEKTKTVTTTTYKTHLDGFYVDVVKTKTDKWHEIEAWIYHKDYGTKSLMFGTYNETEKEFLETVEGNIEIYAGIYRDEIMDE